ncbi:DUF4440 domain-containing protein [Lysinibacillus xylanilyticus]|uniref:nuclear transport factor 2 family protein n=1 Tax=Lysinibacillus xylanilyticus TaxID=582475 RepID=UPI003D05FE96
MEQELCEQILKLEKQLMHDRKVDFENILADNYREFGSSGTIYDKLIQLNSLENEGGFQNIPFVVSDFAIQQLAPYIVHATYCTTSIASDKKSLRSSIWVLRDSEWKMYFHQGTPTLNEAGT